MMETDGTTMHVNWIHVIWNLKYSNKTCRPKKNPTSKKTLEAPFPK
jgi:hypothetical protein